MATHSPVHDWVGRVREARAQIAPSASSYDADSPLNLAIAEADEHQAVDGDPSLPDVPVPPSLDGSRATSPVSLVGDNWADEEAVPILEPYGTDAELNWTSSLPLDYDSDTNVDRDNVPIPHIESSDTSPKLLAFMPGDVLPTAPLSAGSVSVTYSSLRSQYSGNTRARVTVT